MQVFTSPEELDKRAKERVIGELEFLDGHTLMGLMQVRVLGCDRPGKFYGKCLLVVGNAGL